MPKLVYQKKNLRAPTLALIDCANKIILEYAALGLTLTLRQLEEMENLVIKKEP